MVRELGHVDGSESRRDEAVHAIRVSGKRLRAILRLLRGPLGEEMARRMDGVIRAVNKNFSAARESAVTRTQLAQRRKKHDLPTGSAEAKLESQLSNKSHPEALKDLAAMRAALRDLAAEATRAVALPCERTDILRAAAKIYRKARQSAKNLNGSAPDSAYHELRRRAKRLLYALEPLDASGLPPKFLPRLKRLGSRLGRLQDLGLLRGSLAKIPRGERGELPRKMRAEGQELRRSARSLAEKVFRWRTGGFLDRLSASGPRKA